MVLPPTVSPVYFERRRPSPCTRFPLSVDQWLGVLAISQKYVVEIGVREARAALKAVEDRDELSPAARIRIGWQFGLRDFLDMSAEAAAELDGSHDSDDDEEFDINKCINDDGELEDSEKEECSDELGNSHNHELTTQVRTMLDLHTAASDNTLFSIKRMRSAITHKNRWVMLKMRMPDFVVTPSHHWQY